MAEQVVPDLHDDIRSSKRTDHSAKASIADEGKLNLPDDILSLKESKHSWTAKVDISGGNGGESMLSAILDDSKDNSIPLSPQWLYAKPSQPKMEPRLSSLGNPKENNQKDGRCSRGTEDKKDRRRVNADNENSRRWLEEERETSSVSGRSDRRKLERRDNRDNAPAREAGGNRALPNSDRRRHETRCDNKWPSSRWGPDEKDKEISSRAEKKPDVEKEEAHTESRTSVASNHPGSECDADSRDKWRPQHRLEVHSGGPMATDHTAPGFGGEKVRAEGSNLGFSTGRGRGSVSCQTSSLGSTEKSESIPGKPRYSGDVFCYPRGKILDLYRLKNLESVFVTMPNDMEESPPLTEVSLVEPLAFVAPDAAEEAVLSSIGKGKITSGGVASKTYDRGRPTENIAGDGLESVDGVVDILPSTVVKETKETVKEVEIDDCTFWGNGTRINMMDGKYVNNSEMEDKKLDLENSPDGSIAVVSENNGIYYSKKESCRAYHGVFQPEETDTLEMMNDNSNGEAEVLENDTLPSDILFCYLDPQGEIQGPFLGADIMSWFEQGFLKIDLPIRLADAPKGTPFQNLGVMVAHLKYSNGSTENINQTLEPGKFEPLGANVGYNVPSSVRVPRATDLSMENEPNTALPEFQSLPAVLGSKPENLLNFTGQSSHDFATLDEENAFPGRSTDTGHPVTISSGNAEDLVASSHLVPDFTESGLRNHDTENKSGHLGPLWFALQNGLPNNSRFPNNFPQENNNLNTADQLMSRQFEQQQNMFPGFAQLNDQVLDQNRNHIPNQQMAKFSGPEFIHLGTLRIQKYRQLLLEEQEFLQTQKAFLEEQKQKIELEQSSQDQMLRDLGIRNLLIEPRRSYNNNNNSALEQPVLGQHYFHQSRNHPHRLAEPSSEQLVQARFGQPQSPGPRTVEGERHSKNQSLSAHGSSIRRHNPSDVFQHQLELSERGISPPAGSRHFLQAPRLDGLEDLPPEKIAELEQSCIEYRFRRCHSAPWRQEEDLTEWMRRSDTNRNEEKSKQLLMDILKPKPSNQLAEVVDSTHIVSAKPVSSDNIPVTAKEEQANCEKLILRPDSEAFSLERECKNGDGVDTGFEIKQRMVEQDGSVATGGNSSKLGASNLLSEEITTLDHESVSVKGQEDILPRCAPIPLPHEPSYDDDFPELVRDSIPREKISSTRAREGVNPITPAPNNTGSSSPSDEALFKSSNNSIAEQTGPKKKGKKVKQKPIDPALLGFIYK